MSPSLRRTQDKSTASGRRLSQLSAVSIAATGFWGWTGKYQWVMFKILAAIGPVKVSPLLSNWLMLNRKLASAKSQVDF
jgi:hypothetical protein